MSDIYWHLERVDPRAEHPVTVQDVKLDARLDHDELDPQIDRAIGTVVDDLEPPDGWLGRSLLAQTFDLHLSCWPTRGRILRLPAPPLQAVEGIHYLADVEGDLAPAQLTLDAALYRVVTHAVPGYIELYPWASWPELSQHYQTPVRIRFVAGYGAANDVPEPIRTYIRAKARQELKSHDAIILGTIVAKHPYLDSMLDNYRYRHRW